MDDTTALRTRAEALEESCWRPLRRPASYTNATGQVRARREDTQAAIVAEREYLNLHLNYEDVAEFTYRLGASPQPDETCVAVAGFSCSSGPPGTPAGGEDGTDWCLTVSFTACSGGGAVAGRASNRSLP